MHVNSPLCPSCEEKLKTAHPTLMSFAKTFRTANLDAHVSCSTRSKEDQEAAFAKGTSKAHYGQSAHDFTPALALDWFRLTQANGASFDSVWFKDKLAPAARTAGLVWGGDFRSIHDLPHVELSNWKALVGKK